jgi:hypothetical protein
VCHRVTRAERDLVPARAVQVEPVEVSLKQQTRLALDPDHNLSLDILRIIRAGPAVTRSTPCRATSRRPRPCCTSQNPPIAHHLTDPAHMPAALKCPVEQRPKRPRASATLPPILSLHRAQRPGQAAAPTPGNHSCRLARTSPRDDRARLERSLAEASGAAAASTRPTRRAWFPRSKT